MIPELQESLRSTTLRAAKEAVDEGREVTDVIDGVNVVLKYEGTHTSCGNVRVHSGVFIEGEAYGLEEELHPWSIFKTSSSVYTGGGFMRLEEAERLLKEAGSRDDVSAVEECYPADCDNPLYMFSSSTLEGLVAIWKVENKFRNHEK